MNRKFFVFLLALVLTGPALLFLPWWTTFLVGFLVVVILGRNDHTRYFWAPGLGAAVTWVILTAWQDIPNQQILGDRMAALFHLPSSYFLWGVEGLVGLITAGLGGWLAASIKQRFLISRN